MTAAILPISPFWQLRDSSRYDPDLQPSKTGPVLYEGGDLTHIWGSGAEFFDDTGNSDLRCGPLHQRWTRKYQSGFLSRVSSWPGNIRQQGNIKGFISCQETTKGKYQTAHWYTETTETCIGPQGRPIPTYIYVYTYTCLHVYTHTRNVYTCIVYVHTDAFQSPTRTCIIYGISLFLTNSLIHSVCLLFKQTN